MSKLVQILIAVIPAIPRLIEAIKGLLSRPSKLKSSGLKEFKEDLHDLNLRVTILEADSHPK